MNLFVGQCPSEFGSNTVNNVLFSRYSLKFCGPISIREMCMKQLPRPDLGKNWNKRVS